MRQAVLIPLALIVVTGLAGCERKMTPERLLPFRASLKVEADDSLRITTKAPGADVDAVRESVRYQATRHCLLRRGDSQADWDIDPATGDWAHTVDAQGVMTFRARCRA